MKEGFEQVRPEGESINSIFKNQRAPNINKQLYDIIYIQLL